MTMSTRSFLFVIALAFLLFEGVEAAGGSAHEHLRDVQSFLKRVNKAPLTSIQMEIYSKQPAFDNPLLKNHTVQMRPSYLPGGLYDDPNTVPHPIITQTWQQNGKCPENTIPIRRTKEEDVMRASTVKWYGKKRPVSILKQYPVSSDVTTTGHQHAVAYLAQDKYYGTKVTINLWKPVIETAQHFSLTQLWIIGGSNTTEAGWQVYPAIYGDDNPRVFIYWTSDGYHNTGCYNLFCSGFVQTNQQIVLGGSLSPQSIYHGAQLEFDIFVWKDATGGNWWLQVGSSIVGYWPSSIFTDLNDSASMLEWGGEVHSPSGAGQTSTQMGSGHFPSEGYSKASYVRNIQVVDSSKYLKRANGLGLMEAFPNCYSVLNGTSSNDWGTYIFYGGPGRNSNCP